MDEKISILISDTAKLYPPLWGGPKRIWNLYSNLSEDIYDITYVGIVYEPREFLKKYWVNRIKSNFRDITCRFPLYFYLCYIFGKKAAKNILCDMFIYFFMNTAANFKYILNSQKADILVSSHPWVFSCFRKKNNRIYIYDAHNCEYLLIKQILKGLWCEKIVSERVAKIERDACIKSDVIVACSEKEKEDFINLYKIPSNKIYIIPNGTQIKPLPDYEEKIARKKGLELSGKKTILFVGTYYKPNIEAANHIVNYLAPQLNDYIFLIAGNVGDAFRDVQLPRNIRTFGRISDKELEIIISASDIAINPMFSGAGINIKVLDYLSSGLPAISTKIGARGINAENFKDMIICDENEFVFNIKRLFSDNQLYNRLRENGAKLVKEHFDWKKISKNLDSILKEKHFLKSENLNCEIKL